MKYYISYIYILEIPILAIRERKMGTFRYDEPALLQSTSFICIEVGARGYCAYNVCSCFRRLGLNTKETKDRWYCLNSHQQLFSVPSSFGSIETTKYGMSKQPLHLKFKFKFYRPGRKMRITSFFTAKFSSLVVAPH